MIERRKRGQPQTIMVVSSVGGCVDQKTEENVLEME